MSSISTLPFVDKAFINGELVNAKSGKTFQVFNPSTGEVLGSVPDMDGEDTIEAIESARKAFSQFRHTLAKDREQMLLKVREYFLSNCDAFAKILTMEMVFLVDILIYLI